MISLMGKRRIDPRVEIGYVTLPVADLDRSVAFYERMLGFEITHRVGQSAALLGAGSSHPLLQLAAASPGPNGPYRFSVRYPSREAFAQAWQQISEAGVPFRGVDAGLREALQLSDPDGHALELYWDRARSEWPTQPDGTFRLAPEPLDLKSLGAAIREAPVEDEAAPKEDSAQPLSQPTRDRLREMRLRLLNLHKALLEDAKTAYEMDRGRVPSSASLLQLVINDPWFAWLHPLSELVVRIDETLQADAPATEGDGTVLLDHVGRLLSPGDGGEVFAQRYFEALQRQPAVIVAHAEVRRILKQAK